jgi:Cu(I)/Ag(I) efflux system membrane protein CusA/SilA
VGDVQDVVQSAIGGMNVTETVEGLERYPVNLRYPRELRDNMEALKRVLISTPTGAQIPLSLVSDLKLKRGPPAVKTENATPNAWIYVDIKTSDIGGYVAAAKKQVEDMVKIPAGYSLVWSGQFEYMERAAARMKVVIPLTLLTIFLLLYLNFKRVTESLIVMLSVPFALVGGVWLLWLLDYNLSIAVAVGFIALSGVAAETGVVMLIYLEYAWEEIKAKRKAEGQDISTGDLYEAVMEGAVERVRPKMMTVVAIMAGLVPIMWGSGTGSDVMKRIAAPMIGGMISSTILTLVVIPALYALFKAREIKHSSSGERDGLAPAPLP